MALGSPIARDVSSSNVLAVDTPFACRSEYPTHFCEAHFLLVHLMVGGRYQLRARAVTQACRKHTENLRDILMERAAAMKPPIQMCDALSRNLPKLPQKLEIIDSH